MMMTRYVKQMGLAGFLGLILAGLAAWAHWIWLPTQQDVLDKLGSQARRLRHELQASAAAEDDAKPGTSRIQSPEAAWETIWRGLPPATQRVPLQSAVLAAARDQGVIVSGVQYQGGRAPWSARDEAVLWRQRMVMPVSGTYPALKAWMAQMLREPALTIDDLVMQRTDPASDLLQARVTVSLWWRKPEKAQP